MPSESLVMKRSCKVRSIQPLMTAAAAMMMMMMMMMAVVMSVN